WIERQVPRGSRRQLQNATPRLGAHPSTTVPEQDALEERDLTVIAAGVLVLDSLYSFGLGSRHCHRDTSLSDRSDRFMPGTRQRASSKPTKRRAILAWWQPLISLLRQSVAQNSPAEPGCSPGHPSRGSVSRASPRLAPACSR